MAEVRVRVDSIRESPRIEIIDGDTIVDIANCVSEVRYRLLPGGPGELTLTIPCAILDAQTANVRMYIMKLAKELAAAEIQSPPPAQPRDKAGAAW